MSTTSPHRILELWPKLTPEKQAELIRTAERLAAPHGATADAMKLTTEEIEAIERGRDDFKHGRTLSLEEYRTDMDAFFARIEGKRSTG
jgi:hypothetical protein